MPDHAILFVSVPVPNPSPPLTEDEEMRQLQMLASSAFGSRQSNARVEVEYVYICAINGLSSTHNRLMYYASYFAHIDGSSVAWTNMDGVRRVFEILIDGRDSYNSDPKLNFVAYYADVIRDAAERFDIPHLLLAGVAYIEFGGLPSFMDNVTYGVRSFDWSGPDWVNENLTITNHPDRTSFGNINIQVRRGFEMFGYDNPTSQQRAEVLRSLQDHIENIYMAALHLSILRDIDFAGLSAHEFTDEEIRIVATRYNRGPEISLERVLENTSMGDRVLSNREAILEALNRYN